MERLQVTWKRTFSGYVEDVQTCSLHFTPDTGTLLDNTIRAAVEGLFGTLWGTWKASIGAGIILDQYRWYDQQVWPTASPLLRATDITDVPGTATLTQLPPQLAVSCTLQTEKRNRWGRIYMPFPGTPSLVTATGRLDPGRVDEYAEAWQTFIQGAKTANANPVVYSPRGGVGPPTFTAGSHLPVTSVRVDDIPDIIRSRRYQSAPYRKILAIT